jgi:hypothetical protein
MSTDKSPGSIMADFAALYVLVYQLSSAMNDNNEDAYEQTYYNFEASFPAFVPILMPPPPAVSAPAHPVMPPQFSVSDHPCSICNRTFKTRRYLGCHRRVHMLFKAQSCPAHTARMSHTHMTAACTAQRFIVPHIHSMTLTLPLSPATPPALPHTSQPLALRATQAFTTGTLHRRQAVPSLAWHPTPQGLIKAPHLQ